MNDLRAIYENRFAGAADHRKLVWEVLTREFFQRWVPKTGTVLDLGAGNCEFTNTIEARKKLALDLNPSTRQMAASDVEVISQDVTQSWSVDSGAVDIIFTSNFFEHLPTKDALITCLREAYRVLKGGGRLVAMGPNIRFCGDVYWDFIDHYLPLSDRSIAEAMQVVGFDIEKAVPRFLPFTMTGRKPSRLSVRAYLRMPFLWRVFGKQFLVIARKT